MGRFNYSQYFRALSSVHPRVQRVYQKAQDAFRSIQAGDDPQKSEKLRATLSACLLFILSLTLGVWAYQVTQSESILQWERTHIPSTYLVQRTLQGLGFSHVSDLKLITRLFRSLSLSTDELGGVWMSSDHHWVAYYGEDPKNRDELSFEFYCEICTSPVTSLHWQPLERGWRGFEEVLRILERKKPRVLVSKELPKRAKKRGKPVFRDPREIIY